LCEHHIACDYASFRDKTPTSANAANVVDLNDVHRGAMVDSLSLPAVATGDVEKAVRVILSQLFGRQLFLQKLKPARFRRVWASRLELLPNTSQPASR
jgi:hypothetical protein